MNKNWIRILAVSAAVALLISIGAVAQDAPVADDTPPAPSAEFAPATAENPLWIHIFVALCDNENQGIVPVSPRLGNGNDPYDNLYWGAKFGVKAFFKGAGEWRLVTTITGLDTHVLERALFRHASGKAYIVADAYRGRDIRNAIEDFLLASAGGLRRRMSIEMNDEEIEFLTGGLADVIVYVGHNGLMDFNLDKYPENLDGKARDSIVLACYSKEYFTVPLQKAGAPPLLLTTGLMAPEAYTLKTVLDGRIIGETREQLHDRAAQVYSRYQSSNIDATMKLFESPPPDDFMPAEPDADQAESSE